MSRPFLWALALALWTLVVLAMLREWESVRPRRPPALNVSAPCRVLPEDFRP